MIRRLSILFAAVLPAASVAAAPESFKDCAVCPEMVAVPAGTFRMGSPPDQEAHSDDEGPVHSVTFGRPFAVGRFEVTRAEFAAFVAATGRADIPGCYVEETGSWEDRPDRSWRDPGYDQTDVDPVVCVSWDDARAYTVWLAGRTGRSYRMVSEAEWEYVARAGSSEARFWGDDSAAACGFANVQDRTGKAASPDGHSPHDCDDGIAKTAPVGRYAANSFGLYDTLGNVWEWTADCWIDDYAGAPDDGSAWTHGPCESRILRGGSWYYGPWFVRSAERVGVPAGDRYFDAGFRVALDLD